MARIRRLSPYFKVWLSRDSLPVLGEGGATLLRAVDRYGSITEAARRAGVSYKYAWDRIDEMGRAVGQPLLKTRRGGRMGGGGAELTGMARSLLKNYERVKSFVGRVLEDREYWEAIGLKISARNRFRGVVKSLEKGAVTSTLKIEVQTPVVITAVITREAVEDLGVEPGDTVEAVVKATEVMVAKE